MDVVKVRLGTPVLGTVSLQIDKMIEKGDELIITLKDKFCYNISEGDILTFRRYAYNSDDIPYIITANVTVLREDIKTHTLYTTVPYIPKYAIDLNNSFNDENILKLQENHNVFAQDLTNVYKQSLTIEDINGNVLYETNNFKIPFKYKSIGVTKNDCLTLIESEDTCSKTYEKVKTYKYVYLPKNFSQDSILINNLNSTTRNTIKSSMAFVRFKFNPFYYYSENENGEKECVLWKDGWWSQFNSKPIVPPRPNKRGNVKKVYVNSGHSESVFIKDEYCWNVPLGLGVSMNETALGSEDSFGEEYLNELKTSVIPEVIDMERVKYIPVNENDKKLANIIFDFHFIERVKNLGSRSSNTNLTKDNYYEDGWYISPDEGDKKWWNGYNSTSFDKDLFKTFVNESGNTSDLLGYLNFTDKDVFYSKSKVSKTFIRLSFYTSKDPIEQKLLYYSTIFFNEGELRGKYIKQLAFMEDNGYDISNSTSVVFFNSNKGVSRVDSELSISDEYNTEKSSEGFNIYLFKDDVNIKDINQDGTENEYRTIYMKVEFNHAGCGKVIPMITYPYDGENFSPLTIDNFIENLYIPIQIKYNEDIKRYQYKIVSDNECIKTEDEGKTLRLMLFETKLTQEVI